VAGATLRRGDGVELKALALAEGDNAAARSMRSAGEARSSRAGLLGMFSTRALSLDGAAAFARPPPGPPRERFEFGVLDRERTDQRVA
jgi:hypothetical protein